MGKDQKTVINPRTGRQRPIGKAEEDRRDVETQLEQAAERASAAHQAKKS